MVFIGRHDVRATRDQQADDLARLSSSAGDGGLLIVSSSKLIQGIFRRTAE